MNPVDNNVNVRPQRSEQEQGSGRAGGVDSSTSVAPGSAADSRPIDSESVTLTRTASDLLQLEERLQALPGVDRERVEAIRSAIEGGSYQVDAGRIVDSLLQSETELSR
jgi:negative regulator of flagellin synthesis FlgM